jgi:hypothetical protein
LGRGQRPRKLDAPRGCGGIPARRRSDGAGAWRRRSGGLARGEAAGWRVGNFLAVGVRALRRLYSARASRHGNIWAWDSSIAAPPLEERVGLPACKMTGKFG